MKTKKNTARAMRLLQEAVDTWQDRFDSEDDINGADCVDWLASFITAAKEITRGKE